MVLIINPAEWAFVGTKFWNRGTGALRGKYMELDPFGGPLPPSWKWKDEGDAVVAQQYITDFIAKGYDPRGFHSSSGKNHARRTLQAFQIPSRSVSALLRAIEKDIEDKFPGFKRYVEQLERQPNDRKIQDHLEAYLEAIVNWIACMEPLKKFHGRDKDEVARLIHMRELKVDLLDSLRLAASALVKPVRGDMRACWSRGLVTTMTKWLEKRKIEKPARHVRFSSLLEIHVYSKN